MKNLGRIVCLCLVLLIACKVDQQQVDRDLKEAQRLADVGNCAKAVQIYHSIIEVDKENAFAYNGRGLCYVNLGKDELAIQDFDHAIKLNQSSASLYANRANSKLRLRKFSGAIQDYTKSLKLEPNNSLYRFNRALSYQKATQFIEAKTDFKYIISNAEKNTTDSSLVGESLYFLGELEFRKKEFDSALSNFEEAINFGFYKPNIHGYIGTIMMSKGDYSSAIRQYQHLKTSSDQLNDQYIACVNIASCYITLANTDSACYYFYEAVNLEYNSEPIEKEIAKYCN